MTGCGVSSPSTFVTHRATAWLVTDECLTSDRQACLGPHLRSHRERRSGPALPWLWATHGRHGSRGTCAEHGPSRPSHIYGHHTGDESRHRHQPGEALEVVQMLAWVFTLAIFRVRKPDCRSSHLARRSVVSHISPESAGFSLPASR